MLEHIGHHMTHAPHSVPHTGLIAEARERLKALGVHHLPVLKGDRLVGLITERDLLLVDALLGEGSDTARVDLVMVRPAFTCGPEARLDAVAKQMLVSRLDSAIVVDPEHPTNVLGIFTVTDALRVLASLGEPDAATTLEVEV